MSSAILAIDPGNIESAYCLIEKETYKPIEFGKLPNDVMLDKVRDLEYDTLVLEMIASYGMPVGREVFDTCVFIGRCIGVREYEVAKEKINRRKTPAAYDFIYRKEEKINICGSMKAKDSNIRQALIDRFGVVGTKKQQGFFYGFAKDIWAAYAVGVTYLDKERDKC